MVTIILVSHSHLITDGLKTMIEQMTGKSDAITIVSCGGTDDGRIGTDATKILTAIEENDASEYIYLFGDLGSGILSIETALDLIDDTELEEKCHFFDVPLVEGAFTATVQCLVDFSVDAVKAELNTYLGLIEKVK